MLLSDYYACVYMSRKLGYAHFIKNLLYFATQQVVSIQASTILCTLSKHMFGLPKKECENCFYFLISIIEPFQA